MRLWARWDSRSPRFASPRRSWHYYKCSKCKGRQACRQAAPRIIHWVHPWMDKLWIIHGYSMYPWSSCCGLGETQGRRRIRSAINLSARFAGAACDQTHRRQACSTRMIVPRASQTAKPRQSSLPFWEGLHYRTKGFIPQNDLRTRAVP